MNYTANLIIYIETFINDIIKGKNYISKQKNYIVKTKNWIRKNKD